VKAHPPCVGRCGIFATVQDKDIPQALAKPGAKFHSSATIFKQCQCFAHRAALRAHSSG
jgi:hypothetical protein